MSRIIPNELNKKIRREYRLRFFSVLFFTLAIIIFINIFLVSSSYLLLFLYERAYTQNNSLKTNEEVVKIKEQFILKVLQVDALARKIPSQANGVKINSIDTLFSYINTGIDIQAVEIVSSSQDSKITLRGTAATRDALLQFQDKINKNPSFKDFSIPIDLLAKQKDISFNVTFTYHEN